MTDRFIDFRWRRCESGYSWVEGSRIGELSKHPRQDRFVIEADLLKPGNQAVHVTYYNPLEYYPDIVGTLVRMDIDERSIKEFASNYGCLGYPVEEAFSMGDSIVSGETLSSWKDEVHYLRDVYLLWWQCYSEKQIDEHACQLLQRVSALRVELASNNSTPVIFVEDHNLREKGVTLVVNIVNLRLSELTQAKVLWHDVYKDWALCMVPKSLLGAVWLQFAEEIAVYLRIGSCKVCRSGLITSRSDTEYCSPACRMKAYRRRKAEKRTGSIGKDS